MSRHKHGDPPPAPPGGPHTLFENTEWRPSPGLARTMLALDVLAERTGRRTQRAYLLGLCDQHGVTQDDADQIVAARTSVLARIAGVPDPRPWWARAAAVIGIGF